MDKQLVDEIFKFFFPNEDSPAYTEIGAELAALMFAGALKASKRLDWVPLPPPYPPRLTWLFTSAVKGAWKTFKHDDEIYQIVYTYVRANFRSVYETLLLELYDEVKEFLHNRTY